MFSEGNPSNSIQLMLVLLMMLSLHLIQYLLSPPVTPRLRTSRLPCPTGTKPHQGKHEHANKECTDH